MTRPVGWAVAVVLGLAVAPAPAKGPVLSVPANDGTLHLDVPWPKGVEVPRRSRFEGDGTAWMLVEGDAAYPADRLAAIGPDGMRRDGAFRLVASIPPRAGATGPRKLTLRPATEQEAGKSRFLVMPLEGSKTLGVFEDRRPVFFYNHGTISAPAGVPAERSRSSYVHPIWGLDGEILTDDFPKDHYHHRGLFWGWPHVTVGDEPQRDNWLVQGLRHAFTGWLDQHAGPAVAVLGVQNAWVTDEGRSVADERVWLTLYPAEGDAQAIDLRYTLIPGAKPITLAGAEGKSYGGVTIRFGPRPEKETTIISDRGDTADDLPMTRLAWADLSAKFDGRPNPSGIALLVAPDHPDFPPEWLTRHYGALCVGWPGVKARTLPPGEPVTLRYRLVIHRGAGDRARLAAAQARFAAEAAAVWETAGD
jgi:hypothetical protein